MTPVPTAGAKAAVPDFRKSLPASFVINEQANQLLLSHIADIALLARQASHSVPSKTAFGLWEWGSLWHESGFGK